MITTHTLQITPEYLNLIAEIDEFKGTWRLLGMLAPDRLSALRHVATIERERLLAARLPELSERILAHVREHGRVTIGEMMTITGVSRNTLKEHFRSLVEQRFLVLHGAGRGVWYRLH